MNFSGLAKQQKQYIVLAGIIVVVFVAILVFGIKVSLSSVTESKLDLDDLSLKIESAEEALSSQGRVKADFAETTHELKMILKNIPPNRNYYSWATEIIYAKARLAGLEIDAVDEQTSARGSFNEEEEDSIKLESYSLRITARSGFNNLKSFLELIEKNHPLTRVTGIDISTGMTPEVHDIQLFIQWPANLRSITDAWEIIAAKQQALRKPASKESDTEINASNNAPIPPAPRPGSTLKREVEE